MKYAWIDEHRKAFPLKLMCEMLGVSVSGYRAWQSHEPSPDASSRKRLTDQQMLTLILAIHREFKQVYGSPRIVKELRDRGYPASKARVERLMREHQIRARHKRRYKATTDSRHRYPVAPNLLNRTFNPDAPNKVWASDITYLWTDAGWLYLAVVLDLFNREVVGWSIQPRMTTELVTAALDMAWFKRRPAPGLLHHSDRGSQYASQPYQDRLKTYGMRCSMSRKGNCWDNASVESWFNSFKNERIHGVRFTDHETLKAAVFEYIEVFYNRKRKHSTLGYRSPTQYLEQWIRAQDLQKLVA